VNGVDFQGVVWRDTGDSTARGNGGGRDGTLGLRYPSAKTSGYEAPGQLEDFGPILSEDEPQRIGGVERSFEPTQVFRPAPWVEGRQRGPNRNGYVRSKSMANISPVCPRQEEPLGTSTHWCECRQLRCRSDRGGGASFSIALQAGSLWRRNSVLHPPHQVRQKHGQRSAVAIRRAVTVVAAVE
jgi:hypothetical protein